MDYFVFFNRLGILLNFLAGFLLAPELIGLEKLEKIEKWIESKTPDLIVRIPTLDIEESENFLEDSDYNTGGRVLALGFLTTFFIVPFWFYVYLRGLDAIID